MHPPEDREMPLEEHLAELRSRAIRVSAVLISGTIALFKFSGRFIRVLWGDVLPKNPIYVFTPTEWFMIQLTVAFLLTLTIAYPYIAYEVYQFAKPGLYEHERKLLKTFIPLSYILFLSGMAFAYFLIVPEIFSFASNFSMGAQPYLSLKKTFYSALKITVGFGLGLQIPLLMAMATVFGVADSKRFKDIRLPIYLLVFLLATNVTSDISGISQLLILLLFVSMYEIGILISKVVERGCKRCTTS